MKVSETTKAKLLQEGQLPNLKDDLIANSKTFCSSESDTACWATQAWALNDLRELKDSQTKTLPTPTAENQHFQ